MRHWWLEAWVRRERYWYAKNLQESIDFTIMKTSYEVNWIFETLGLQFWLCLLLAADEFSKLRCLCDFKPYMRLTPYVPYVPYVPLHLICHRIFGCFTLYMFFCLTCLGLSVPYFNVFLAHLSLMHLSNLAYFIFDLSDVIKSPLKADF